MLSGFTGNDDVHISNYPYIDYPNPLTEASGILDADLSGVAQAGTSGTLGQLTTLDRFAIMGEFINWGDVEFALDLHRILATNGGAGTITGGLDSEGNAVPVRTSTYEGTIIIKSTGEVGFYVIPGPSSVILLGLAAGALFFRRRRNASPPQPM